MNFKLAAIALVACMTLFSACSTKKAEAITPATPKTADSLLHEAEALMYEQHYDEAVRVISHVIETEGPSAYAYTLRGIAFSKSNKPFFAIADLLEAVNINYTPETLINLGNAERNAGFCERATDAFQKALALSPNDFQVLVNLGSSYICYGALELGENALNQANKINSNDAILQTNYAQLYSMQNKWPNARAAAEKALQLDSAYFPAYKILAKACGELGDKECVKNANHQYKITSAPKMRVTHVKVDY